MSISKEKYIHTHTYIPDKSSLVSDMVVRGGLVVAVVSVFVCVEKERMMVREGRKEGEGVKEAALSM